MIHIYSPYRPPKLSGTVVPGESVTVQGLVTSMSAILSGYDDNNMSAGKEAHYSGEAVVDLYPEVFGRPTKYELDYIKQEYEPGGPSDLPGQETTSSEQPAPPAAAPSEPAPPDSPKS